MSIFDATTARSNFFKSPEWLGFPHEGYRVGPLQTYISSRRENNTLKIAETTKESVLKAAAEYQSLLTFGLLESVIEAPVAEDMVLERNPNGKLFMTTKHLVTIIRDWLYRIDQAQPDARKSWLERTNANLRVANSLMVSFATRDFWVFRPLGDMSPSMVCFIVMVAEALESARSRLVPTSGVRLEGFSWSMIWTPSHKDALRKSMHSDGWCPHTVEYLVSARLVSSLKYAYDHRPAETNRHHEHCSQKSCVAYDVDIDNYTSKHTDECKCLQTLLKRPCEYVKPDLDQVVTYISHGHVPVVSLDPGGLQVHKSSEISYVAISHVWADGLGSNSETGLPLYQLRRLDSLVSTLQQGAAFWIDSLCIPGAQEPRKKAIKMMSRTYEAAERVLVLDSSLESMESTEPKGVKLLRTLTSGWMRRLWTLQEAVLAKRLFFQFSDAQQEISSLLSCSFDMLLFPHETDLAIELFRLTKKVSYGAYEIGDVARSLRWRRTSRGSDETLAIASLLRLGISRLLDVAPEQRMCQLFQDLYKIPRNVLFLNGPKMSSPGFRWAPPSFMAAHGGSEGGVQLSAALNDAICTSIGLRASYQALVFPEMTLGVNGPWGVRDPRANRLYEIRDLPLAKSYQCNMLLFPDSIAAGNASPCVGVLQRPSSVEKHADGSFTVHCEYKARLVIVNVAEEDGRTRMVDSTLSGGLKVCVS
ncbi:hypothetical protein C7974DRAFT_219285 [Boeremia exigua]|uniref:uncharacterized protein n=1 Tax=Boeremia exigua TaxID=749465 RepID=UPI001E8CC4C8|nr:uncharacterized protein C7974DRAFT_219285 [Boeremia exigua]KAH6622268.1 hypothetical protein C7974DRAFT_219285 [Boeremia exigua]